jgi:hypothetical protein
MPVEESVEKLPEPPAETSAEHRLTCQFVPSLEKVHPELVTSANVADPLIVHPPEQLYVAVPAPLFCVSNEAPGQLEAAGIVTAIAEPLLVETSAPASVGFVAPEGRKFPDEHGAVKQIV